VRFVLRNLGNGPKVKQVYWNFIDEVFIDEVDRVLTLRVKTSKMTREISSRRRKAKTTILDRGWRSHLPQCKVAAVDSDMCVSTDSRQSGNPHWYWLGVNAAWSWAINAGVVLHTGAWTVRRRVISWSTWSLLKVRKRGCSVYSMFIAATLNIMKSWEVVSPNDVGLLHWPFESAGLDRPTYHSDLPMWGFR